MMPQPTAVVVMTDHALLLRIETMLTAAEQALSQVTQQLGNTRLYEAEAADYLGVKKRTMLQYRERGLPYEKVGRITSYLRKDLDAWRSSGATRHVDVS